MRSAADHCQPWTAQQMPRGGQRSLPGQSSAGEVAARPTAPPASPAVAGCST